MSGRFRLLCIDLPVGWQMPLQAAFESAGGEWLLATTLEESSVILASQVVNAIFAPILVAGLPPLGIIPWVQNLQQNLPVVIVSTADTAGLAENARQAGAAEFLILSSDETNPGRAIQSSFHHSGFPLTALFEEQISMSSDKPLDRFDQLVALSPAVIFTCAATEKLPFTSVSENLESLTGFPISEFLGNPDFWYQRIHPQDLPTVLEAVQSIHRQPAVGFEYRFHHRLGHYLWLHDEWRMVRDENQVELEIIGSTMDISKVKEAQQELQSRLRFEELIINLITRFINAPVDQINEAIVNILGTLGSYLQADSTYFYLVDEDITEIAEIYEWSARQTNRTGFSLKGLKLEPFPWSIRLLKAGEFLRIDRVTDLPQEAEPERNQWLNQGLHAMLAIPVFSHEKMIGFFGASAFRPNPKWHNVDLTAFYVVRDALANVWSRMKTETTLRDREERFRLLAENSSDVIALHSIHSNDIVYISPSCIRLTGYSPTEMIGRRPKEFMPPEDWARNKVIFAQMLESGLDASIYEYHFLHKSMGPLWVESTIQAIRDSNGAIQHFVSVTRDISERKRSEQTLLATQTQLTLQVNELARRTQELSTLTEMGNMLQVCSQVEEACDVITQFAARLFPGTSGYIAMLVGKTTDLEIRQKWGSPSLIHRRFRLNECWGVRKSRPHFKQNPSIGLNCTHLDPVPTRSYLCVPIHTHSRPVALLHIQAEEDHALNENQVQLAATTGEQIGLGLTNLELRQSLMEQTRRDALTGLMSRSFLEETLEQEFARACTTIQPLSIILVDIDHFRDVNAVLGHYQADQVLCNLADLLHNQLEKEDILGRFGGDEFMVILPNTQLEAAYQRAEGLRARVRSTALLAQKTSLRTVTISVGVACWPTHGESPTSLVKAVSLALVEAKKNRDQVSLANLPSRPVV